MIFFVDNEIRRSFHAVKHFDVSKLTVSSCDLINHKGKFARLIRRKTFCAEIMINVAQHVQCNAFNVLPCQPAGHNYWILIVLLQNRTVILI